MKKKWVQFVVCLLLSAGIWFIHNYSQKYVGIASVSIAVESKLDGYASKSSNESTITAQVLASGFQLNSLLRHKAIQTIEVESSDLVKLNKNTFTIPNSSLLKYTKELFGEGVSIESFVSESPNFVFADVIHKKVPIRRETDITMAPQYMALKQLFLTPDSLTIYGESAYLENIEYVQTRPIVLKNVDASTHGKVKIESPSKGIRLSINEAIYTLEVSRYVELKSEIKVQTINVPVGQELVILPSSVTMVFRQTFPSNVNPKETVKLIVDYNDYLTSIGGRCIPHIEGLPSTVINYTMSPQVLDCVLISK